VSSPARLTSSAAELRAAFDRAFSESETRVRPPTIDVLAIRVSGQPYALRLSEVLAVHTERKLVPAPAPAPELLGLAGIRGLVVPVYDLRLLLGHAAGPPPRWLALARASSALAVAFEALDGHLRLPEGQVVAASAGADPSGPFAPGSVLGVDGPRPLLHLPSLLARVSGHTSAASALKPEETP
jgi:purine-binding chemotaxis protein CheW